MATAVVFTVLAVFALASCEECVFEKNVDFPEISPLILDSGLQMVLPVVDGESRKIRVSSGTILTLACPGSKLTNLGEAVMEAKCEGGSSLSVNGKEMKLSNLGCKKKPKSSIRSNLGSCGHEGSGTIESIGFSIDDSRFYEVIKICFDIKSETTLYSEHTVRGAHIAAKDIDPVRPSFKTSSGFFNISMSTCYSKKSQLKLMKNLLGDNDLANTMINSRKQYYFAKGHMAPDADFVTEAEQDATYYYINAVPQWQAFNNGNWKYLEMATRELAEKLGLDLKVYSGGWGVLELDDINANPLEIFLGLSVGEKLIPAPAVTWKVVYDKTNARAVGMVGVNNPHITSAPTPLCQDLCSSIPWIDFNVNDVGHGYTYCCTVENLRKAIPHVPNFGAVELLGNSDSHTGGGCA